jgi:iron complex outermembrane receptor protein
MSFPLHGPRATALAAGLFCALTGVASAQTVPSAPEPAASAPVTLLPAVRATAAQETATSPVRGYQAKRSATATKTDTPLKETPQSVTVVPRDQFVDQGATTTQDALNYAAGVRSDAYGIDSRSDGVRIRGFYPDEYLDGLRKNFDYYTSNARTEVYTLERIDVLRGPAAMTYGQGSTGGVVNMVSKRPQAETAGEIGVQYGSWDRRQINADLTGPVTDDGQWLYRVIGVARNADTQVDYVRDDRYVLAPSLTWQPSAATSLTFQALVQRDRSGSTSQFFPWSGTVSSNPNGTLPTNRFIGDPDWDRYDTDRNSFGWLFEHKLSDTWKLRQNARYTKTDVDYRSMYGDSFTNAGGWIDPAQRVIGRFADGSQTHTRLLTLDQNLNGSIDAGSTKHELLGGVDYARYRKSSASAIDYPDYYLSPPNTVPGVDAYNPSYPAYTPPSFSPNPTSVLEQVGFYLQDQMRVGQFLLLTAGARVDHVRNTTEGDSERNDRAFTKRFGAMVLLPRGWSPFVSYSESFAPVANQGAQTGFVPTRGKQWEAGVKYEPDGGAVSFNVAAFDVREKNQLVWNPPPVDYTQSGQSKVAGVELELKAAPTRQLDLIANYTFTNVRDGTTEEVPQNQASAWTKYRFALGEVGGLWAGIGARYISAFHDGAAPTVPSVTLVDVGLGWENRNWRAALNVTNLTDEVYVATCLRRGDCWFGARRNAIASLTYMW